ncbi:DUF2752 domain-containing protein [Armatimonas sp.]|uniref:DUF2752 domain-containing protein n=1 Tax=Armatimonas sp. TaxID=1872638 RepID=UPI00286AFC26|nr:DUF2752 domain-containing protein [Armatimonas sp.]
MKSTPLPTTAGKFLLWLPLGILAAAFLVPPPGPDNKSLLGLPDICPIHALTHIPCPGCGISRSLVCTAHGELTRAFVLHPLGPVFFTILVGFVVLRFFPRLQPSSKTVNLGAGILTVLLIALWVVRLLGWLPKPP